MSQLALALKLEDHAVFETFLPAGNEELIAFLDEMIGARRGPGCWLWGRPATGKSHLLQAVCDRAGGGAAFLPLSDLLVAGPGIMEGMAGRAFVCIDDVQLAAGDAAWERGLFNLFNDASESRSCLVMASNASPRETRFELADLASRCSLLPAFHVRDLDEADRRRALKLRARHRGLELPDETARFLITRSRRDMASLYSLLDRLDTEALAAQRRLTVPFVKTVLDR